MSVALVAASLLVGGTSFGDPSTSKEHVLSALEEMGKPDFPRRNAAERNRMIDEIVTGIDVVLPTINDAQRLLDYAAALIRNGMARPVNLLDYWGDDPRTQAILNPIAETIDKVMKRAETVSKTKADTLIKQIKAPDDPKVKLWEEADNLRKVTLYTWACATYGLAISYDKSNPKRAEVCRRAIAQLKEFDVYDINTPVAVQLYIAKLNMALGGPDGYDAAKAYFKKIIDSKANDPKRYVNDQYNARYFTLVADVLNHRAKAADDAFDGLLKWQEANLPRDKATQAGAQAAASMLQYRIKSALADAALEPKEQQKLHAQAVAILLDLAASRPDLRSIIDEKLGRGDSVDHVIGVAVGRGMGMGSGKGSGAGDGPKAQKIVYVIDAAGHMIAFWDPVGVQIRSTIKQLSDQDSFGIVFINDQKPEPLARKLLAATDENKKKAVDYLNAMAPRGSTDPLPALVKAFALKPEMIFLLIDPSDIPDKLAILKLVAQDEHKKVKLNVIALEGRDAENEKFLESLAKESGGMYRYVTTKDLQQQ